MIALTIDGNVLFTHLFTSLLSLSPHQILSSTRAKTGSALLIPNTLKDFHGPYHPEVHSEYW